MLLKFLNKYQMFNFVNKNKTHNKQKNHKKGIKKLKGS